MEPITNEELKNEEAAEKLSEESTDLARELADEDEEYKKAKADALASMKEAAKSSQAVANLINEITNEETTGYEPSAEEIKEINDFNEVFAGKNPLKVLVELNARIQELEKKVF